MADRSIVTIARQGIGGGALHGLIADGGVVAGGHGVVSGAEAHSRIRAAGRLFERPHADRRAVGAGGIVLESAGADGDIGPAARRRIERAIADSGVAAVGGVRIERLEADGGVVAAARVGVERIVADGGIGVCSALNRCERRIKLRRHLGL